MMYDNVTEITELIGKTISGVENNHEQIDFYLDNGEHYRMHHIQDCCESVTVEDICEDLNDIVGSPVVMAEEVTHHDETPEGVSFNDEYSGLESYTWTFYKIGTQKGSVTIRWLGESNGYYSEEVDFEKVA